LSVTGGCVKFRERKGGRNRNINDERESSIGCLLHTPCTGDQARKQGM